MSLSFGTHSTQTTSRFATEINFSMINREFARKHRENPDTPMLPLPDTKSGRYPLEPLSPSDVFGFLRAI
jgi:hypothetical protein